MPRYLANSRVSKPVAQSSNHRLPLSQFLSSARRSKPNSQLKAVVKALDQDASDDDNDEADQLLKVIKTVPVFNAAAVRDAPSVMQYVAKTMFSSLPDRAGMNSVRIAEVLNFQKKLPPIVSVAHVHAIISASSKTEREIQALLTNGTMLKLRVTGRGNDVTGLSEVLILLSDYRQMLHASELPEETVATFVNLLTRNPSSTSISSRDLSASVSTSLITAGFLVSSSLLGSRNLSLSGSSLTGVPVISRAVSGTTAAIGGEAAFERLGGVGSSLRRTNSAPCDIAVEFVLSVPNIGVYLRLLDAGRQHLLHLLRMSKHRQAPLYLLRERWDGAVDSDSSVSQAKRLRGEFSQILPAKTKKWKKLSGLNFDWALEECLGAGMIELFETHAVGLGVRALV